MQPRIKVNFRVEEEEGKGFHAYCPEIKGIYIFCETEAELLPAIHESVNAYLEMSRKHGDPIPSAIVVPEETPEQVILPNPEAEWEPRALKELDAVFA